MTDHLQATLEQLRDERGRLDTLITALERYCEAAPAPAKKSRVVDIDTPAADKPVRRKGKKAAAEKAPTGEAALAHAQKLEEAREQWRKDVAPILKNTGKGSIERGDAIRELAKVRECSTSMVGIRLKQAEDGTL